MRPIRVMHILSDLEIGGAQRVALDLVTNLDRSRFRPHVCTLRGGGALVAKLQEQRIRHDTVYFSSRFSLLGLWRLRALLQDLEIDVVHTHLRRANLSGRLAAIWAGTPVIIAQAHDMLPLGRPLHRAAQRWLQGRTDRFLCISRAVAEAQAEELGCSPSRFTILYNFVDPQRFRIDCPAQLAKADIGIPVESPCVGIVGRLNPVKGHDLFLETAFRLNQVRPDVHFAIVGEGARKEALREKARQLGMMHKVTFVGAAHEMARIYRALDVLALCSSSEGLGMVLLEAQAAGVPVVARAVGGVPEALARGGGILVDEPTPKAMAGALQEALKPATARMLRGQIPANLERFNAARQITTLEEIYEESCERKGVAG